MSRSGFRKHAGMLAVAYRELAIIRHDRELLIVIFFQPLMTLLVYGLAVSFTPANVPLLVLDRSGTSLSRRLVDDVAATGYFAPPARVASYDEGMDRLQDGSALGLLVIPASFPRALERGDAEVQLLLDGTDPLMASRVAASIGAVGRSFGMSNGEAGGERAALVIAQEFRFNHTLRDRDFFLAVIAGILLTNICLSATSLGIVGERERGTLEQLLAAPVSSRALIAGKLLPHALISYAALFLIMSGCGMLFGLWPRGSWAAIVLVTFPFVLASLGFGVLVSIVCRTSVQAVFLSVFFILPSFMLSGATFSYRLMPPAIRHAAGILPLRWYQMALRDVVQRGAGVPEILAPAMVLVLIASGVLLAINRRMDARLD